VVAAELLPLAAARAALALPASEETRGRVIEALGPLAGRPDLPEAGVFRAQLEVRRGHASGTGGAWTSERVQRVGGSVADGPMKGLLLAECYYNFARSVRGPAAGCWRSCFELADGFLRGTGPKTGLAFSDGVLLRELARLMLGDPAGPSEASPEGLLAGHAAWVGAVHFLGRYVRTPWPRQTAIPGLGALDHPPTVLRTEDVALLRAAAAQAQGLPEAGSGPLFESRDASWFYGIGLLRARRARFAGDLRSANDEYARLVAGGDLLDVVAAEQFSA
jgi:hypothetical protein